MIDYPPFILSCHDLQLDNSFAFNKITDTINSTAGFKFIRIISLLDAKMRAGVCERLVH